ncbi:MAG: ABC transporter ATP-binding protein, partial [Clostridia bacterium]|nr:ABC transporter ATP-binding protein [Clostridia bacterium]
MPKQHISPNMPSVKTKGVLLRTLKTLYGYYPVLMPVATFCMVFSAVVAAVPSVFMQQVIELIDQSYKSGDYASVAGEIVRLILILSSLYLLSLAAGFIQSQLMAVITQGFLKKLRKKMFDGMQNLPISYFDTHRYGDIMSYYTNDID